jgi:SAM-dependent methyltransferase
MPRPRNPMSDDIKTFYEKNQNYNPLVAYLHSLRYKHLIALFELISSQDSQKTLKVIDIGCAHAKTFGLINDKFKINYIGIELNQGFSDTANNRYKSFENFKIINDSVENHFSEFDDSDIILALETLEHIPEHIVVRIVEKIALTNPKAFMCSVPNEVGPIVWVKNVGSLLTGYMRHKEYKWRETFYAGLYCLDKVETHDIGHKGFDWRWLAQTIRHNMKITKCYSTPFRWLPRTFSFSVIFWCLRED